MATPATVARIEPTGRSVSGEKYANNGSIMNIFIKSLIIDILWIMYRRMFGTSRVIRDGCSQRTVAEGPIVLRRGPDAVAQRPTECATSGSAGVRSGVSADQAAKRAERFRKRREIAWAGAEREERDGSIGSGCD